MKRVEIYRLTPQGTEELSAECKLQDDSVECTGNEQLVDMLNSEGITDHSQTTANKLYPKDGERFLEELKHNFKSGYLNATDVIDDTEK